MKKILYIVLVLVVAFIGWYCLTNQNMQKSEISEPTNAVTELQSETNPVRATPNISVKVPRPSPSVETNEAIIEMTNALTATNLEQWKAAIKDLKQLAGFQFDQHWLMEQHGRTNGVPITLSFGDKAIQYNAVLISVNAENGTGQIMRVEMQTLNMNIDETRKLGLQLCNMFGFHPSDFLAWCDKVGNHWLDSPLYSSINIRDQNNNERFGFQTLHTYNDDEPWMINFVITSP